MEENDEIWRKIIASKDNGELKQSGEAEIYRV